MAALTPVTVFLNKSDILEKKLNSGVMVNKYIPRYGSRENSLPVFSACRSISPLMLMELTMSLCVQILEINSEST